MVISTIARDVAIPCTYKDLVSGKSVNEYTNIIDATKIKLVGESEYVQIVDGKISLTEAGIQAASSISNYVIRVSADGKEANLTINVADATDGVVGDNTLYLDSENVGKNITAAYLDGTTVDVVYDGGVSYIVKASAEGAIVVYADGEVIAIVTVA